MVKMKLSVQMKGTLFQGWQMGVSVPEEYESVLRMYWSVVHKLFHNQQGWISAENSQSKSPVELAYVVILVAMTGSPLMRWLGGCEVHYSFWTYTNLHLSLYGLIQSLIISQRTGGKVDFGWHDVNIKNMRYIGNYIIHSLSLPDSRYVLRCNVNFVDLDSVGIVLNRDIICGRHYPT